MKVPTHSEAPRHEPALGVVARGLAAGFAGTLLLSVFARLFPWDGQWWTTAFGGRRREATGGPRVAAEPHAPWAAPHDLSELVGPGAESIVAMTPADALAQASGPGPEGAAERFALKLASGLFSRDLSPTLKPAGLAVHVAYGSFWGAVYGLLQSGLAWSPNLGGLLHGLGVWAFGPGWLVPAMKLMRPPDEQAPATNLRLVAGHLLYGLAVSRVFALLARKAHDD